MGIFSKLFSNEISNDKEKENELFRNKEILREVPNHKNFKQQNVFLKDSKCMGYKTAAKDLISRNQVLLTIILDSSYSMNHHKQEVLTALKEMKQAIMDSKEMDSIQVSIIQFDARVVVKPFTNVQKLNIQNYDAIGEWTRLYDAIYEAQRQINNYSKELEDEDKDIKGMNVAILSDGLDNYSQVKLDTIKQVVEETQLDPTSGFNGKINYVFWALDHDAVKAANRIGIKYMQELNSTAHSIRSAMNLITRQTIQMSKRH